MSPSEKREYLEESIKQLSGDTRFQVFIEALREMKDECVASAASVVALKNQRTQAAAMGEVKAYVDILALVAEYGEQARREFEAQQEYDRLQAQLQQQG